MVESDPALAASRAILKTLRVATVVAGLILAGWFVATFLLDAEVILAPFETDPAGVDVAGFLRGLRIWMVLGWLMIPVVCVLLTRLLEIVESVRLGDAFVAENASRLQTIAWCLLAVQLLDLAFGAMAGLLAGAGVEIHWSPSVTGWVAVVLLFVLARVFEQGTRIRDDLAAMI